MHAEPNEFVQRGHGWLLWLGERLRIRTKVARVRIKIKFIVSDLIWSTVHLQVINEAYSSFRLSRAAWRSLLDSPVLGETPQSLGTCLHAPSLAVLGQKGACRSQDGPLEAALRPGQPKWNRPGGPAAIPILCATEPLNPTGAAAHGLGSAALLSSSSGLQSPAPPVPAPRSPSRQGERGDAWEQQAMWWRLRAGIQGHCQRCEAAAAQPCLPRGTEHPLSR